MEKELNGFPRQDNDEKTISYLKDKTESLVADEIMKLTNTDNTNGLEIFVNGSIDHLNKSCYAVLVENYKSPILEVTIYPKEDNTEQKAVQERKIANGVNLLELELEPNPDTIIPEELKGFLFYKTKKHIEARLNIEETESAYKEAMVNLLIEDLQSEENMKFAIAHNIAYKYLSENKWFLEDDMDVANEH